MKRFFTYLFIFITMSVTVCSAETYKQAHVKQILLKDINQVIEVQEKLNSGTSFENLAREYSICKTGQRGGDIGTIKQGTMIEAYDNAIIETRNGAISRPFKTQYGWYILKIVDKK